jgi:hypothetical protein
MKMLLARSYAISCPETLNKETLVTFHMDDVLVWVYLKHSFHLLSKGDSNVTAPKLVIDIDSTAPGEKQISVLLVITKPAFDGALDQFISISSRRLLRSNSLNRSAIDYPPLNNSFYEYALGIIPFANPVGGKYHEYRNRCY